MAIKPKVVIDTNVFIPALLGHGSAALVYGCFLQEKFQLVLSPALFKEITAVLNRAELKINPAKIKRLKELLRSQAAIDKPKEKIKICRDPADNAILACAQSARANFIISWDKDLLSLSPFQGIPVLTPAEFLLILSPKQ
jgi:putative PIN family toxin of toxin-antitoxin system